MTPTKPSTKASLTVVVDQWFRRHPAAMLAATVVMAAAAAVALLFVGHSEPILYQAF